MKTLKRIAVAGVIAITVPLAIVTAASIHEIWRTSEDTQNNSSGK